MNRPDSDDALRHSDDGRGDASFPGGGDPDPGVAWMREFQAGDEGAFDRLVARYQTGVFHFIRSSIRDAGRAEDLTQDVFIRVYRARHRYQPTARFKTWLFTIAGRLVLNEARAIQRRRKVFTDVSSRGTAGEESGDDDFWVSVSDADTDDPGELAERSELEDVVKRLVEALPPNQRAAIELQRSERFSYQDISEILGVSSMAVKSLLVRAREKLRLGLEPYLSGRRSTDAAPARSGRGPAAGAGKNDHEK